MEGIGGNVTLKGRYRLVGRVESDDGRELWEGAGGQWPVPMVIQILGQSATGELEARRRRFEALRWPRLLHPNVEHMLDLDEDGSTYFLVLRFWKGESIGERMRRGESISLAEALLAGKVAAEVVQAVHDLGQPLGELSTDDLMTNSGGRVIVTDIARTRVRPNLRPSPPLTDLSVGGDLSGRSKEGLAPSARQSDVVGLASLLYELITDHRPEPALEKDDVWAVEGPLFTPLESARPAVPLELARVCNSVLSGGAAARLLSAGAFARVLDRVLGELRSQSSPQPGGSEEPSASSGPGTDGIIDLQGTLPIVDLPDPATVEEASGTSAQPIRDRAAKRAVQWIREGEHELSRRGLRVATAVFVTLLIASLTAWAIIRPSASHELRPARSPTVAGGAPGTAASPLTEPSPAISVASAGTLQHMPDVLGMTVAEARVVLLGTGLRVKTVVPVQGVPSEIVRTDPASGTDVPPGTKVTLFVGVLPDRLSPSAPPA
jgi:hypothetical protein